MTTPPLPAGYALDQPSSTPPLPAGYSLDTATQKAPETGVWAGIKRNTVGMVSGLYHALTDPATDEEKQQLLKKVQDERDREHAAGRDPNNVPISLATDPSQVTLAYHRLVDAPASVLAKKGTDEQAAAKDLLAQGKTWNGSNQYVSGMTDRLLSAVPGVGPWLNSVAERAERGDYSGAATDITSAVAFSRAPEMANALAKSKLGQAAASALDTSAAKNYEDVLNPTKETTKFQTQKITPQLLKERPIALTRQGLADTAASQAESAGQAIEQKVSTLQGTASTKPIVDSLQNLKKAYQVNGVSLRPEVDNAIDAVSQQIQSMGPDISLQDAVKARRILDSAVAEAKGYQGAQLSDSSMAAIRKETANSIRSELAKASPDLASLNQRFHFWNTLNDVMEQTIQRKTGQAPLLREMIGNAAAGGAGLAAGGVSGAAGYGGALYILGKALRSTGWRTVSAATKASVADAFANGDFAKVGELVRGVGLTGQATAAASATQ